MPSVGGVSIFQDPFVTSDQIVMRVTKFTSSTSRINVSFRSNLSFWFFQDHRFSEMAIMSKVHKPDN